MKTIRTFIGPIGTLAIALATALFAESARGELLDISADVEADVAIFDSDTVLVSNDDMITVGIDQTGIASAQATRLRLRPVGVAAIGRSRMFFTDPFPDPPDPIQEFGGELFGFSNDNTLSIQMTGDVFETRTIVVTPQEAGAREGKTTIVTGDMFFNGAIVVISNRQDGDLTGLEALAGFEIELMRTDADPVIVQSGVIEVRGTMDNQIIVTGDGSLAGFDFPTVDLSPEFAEFGNVHVVLIPKILIPYLYTVNVGEEYVLEGRLRLKTTNVPDSVGVGISTGGPFVDLANILNQIFSGPFGNLLEKRIKELLEGFTPVAPDSSPFALLTESCAPMGIESLGLVGLLGAIGMTRRRRRLRRSSSTGHRHSGD